MSSAALISNENSSTAGVWANADNGQTVGLVAQPDMAYIVLWPDTAHARGRLPFALGLDRKSWDVTVQVPDPDCKLRPRTYSLRELVSLVDRVAALEAKLAD